MNQIRASFLVLFFLAVFVWLIASCGGGETVVTPPTTNTTSAGGVETDSSTSPGWIKVGRDMQLAEIVLPSGVKCTILDGPKGHSLDCVWPS